MSALRPDSRARTVAVDVAEALPRLDQAAPEEWHLHILDAGVPVATVRLPAPGAGLADQLLEATVVPYAYPGRVQRAFAAAFASRLGASGSPAPARPSCSVIVCTHRRPEALRRLLDATGRLDPAPEEVVVVDNAPRGTDCRAVAEAAGARYVREDRPGLNVARHAGACAARGEVLAYTDDDCIPPPGWLARLGEHFADPSVVAVTGPALAWSLDAPAQRTRERMASFVQGWELRVHDLVTRRPVDSGGIGAGANMVVRRVALEELPEPFPAELDAGTPTRSGGDLYLLSRLLAAGGRVRYDPATYVFHDHRADPAGPPETARAYGTGLAAHLTKALVEDRDIAAVATWLWLWSRFVSAGLLALSGQDDGTALRLRARYLRGGLAGAPAWLRAARRTAVRTGPVPAIAPPGPARARPVAHGARSALSVVVVLSEDRAPEVLEALDRDAGAAEGVELVVVDTRPRPTSLPALATRVVHVRRPGMGAAAARNAGARAATNDLLLLWDERLAPEPGALAAHVRRHAGEHGDVVVVGDELGDPAARGLAARVTALERAARQRRRRLATTSTLADLAWTNVSLRRAVLERTGGFDEGLGAPGAERVWAARALTGGVRIAVEADAAGRRRERGGAAVHLARATAEGAGDAALLVRHPEAIGALRCARPASPAEVVVAALLAAPQGERAATAAIDALEMLRARSAWLRAFALARRACYERGLRRAGGATRAAAAREAAVLTVELQDDRPLPEPALAAPSLRLCAGGRRVAQLVPDDGQWHAELPHAVTAALERAWRPQAASAWWRALPAASAGLPPASRDPDATGITVLLGPGREGGDDRHRAALERAGATVRLLHGERRDHWAVVDDALHAERGRAVAIPLPGVALHPDWLAAARPVLDGERIAVVAGAGLRPGEPPDPLHLRDRAAVRAPLRSILRPAQCVLLTPAGAAALGGFAPAAADLGDAAAVLDLLERALDAGLLIGELSAPGLTPPGVYRPARVRNEWERWSACGALHVREALRRGGPGGAAWLVSRGLIPFVELARSSRRTGSPSARHLAGSVLAFSAGAVTGGRRVRARRRA